MNSKKQKTLTTDQTPRPNGTDAVNQEYLTATQTAHALGVNRRTLTRYAADPEYGFLFVPAYTMRFEHLKPNGRSFWSDWQIRLIGCVFAGTITTDQAKNLIEQKRLTDAERVFADAQNSVSQKSPNPKN